MKTLYVTSVAVLWFTCEAQANGLIVPSHLQPSAHGFTGESVRQLPDTELLEILASKRNELLEMAFERLGSDKYVDEMLAISWLIDFKNLVPDQKLVTKKGIQDILFEAQLGNLRWDSVAVNEPHRTKECKAKAGSVWVIPKADTDVNPDFPCIIVCKNHSVM